jgi:hypothetical protein
MDNQFPAPNDGAIDNQLCSRDGWAADFNSARWAAILNQSGMGTPILLLCELIQEFPIDFADGSLLCDRDRPVDHKYANRGQKKDGSPELRWLRLQYARNENPNVLGFHPSPAITQPRDFFSLHRAEK